MILIKNSDYYSVLIMLMIFFSSCSKVEKKCFVEKNEITSKLDSLVKSTSKLEESTGFVFFKLLEKETQTDNDTILIRDYKTLLGKNKFLDIYIWDRIMSISNLSNYNLIKEQFTGSYRLKSIQDNKDSRVNSILIKNDSCYLYKNTSLVTSGEVKIINSSNKFTKGIIRVENFRINLHSSNFGTLLYVTDNFCMDCNQMEFTKNN